MDNLRFLDRAMCRGIADRIFAMATGGGTTRVTIESVWRGSLRWARNTIISGGETQVPDIRITRTIRTAYGEATTNVVDDMMFRTSLARAEALVKLRGVSPDDYPDPLPVQRPHTSPVLWFDRTLAADDPTRAATAARMIAPTRATKLLSAGYLEVAGRGAGIMTSDGVFRYYPYTTAQCSITVRDPNRHGSGWAGVDWNDWGRINTEYLAQTALEKCERSKNPVAIEPGRYTVLLEPQAVCDLVAPLVESTLDRQVAERGDGPFTDSARRGCSKLGQRVLDPRLTLSANPMDPECGFVPFDSSGEPYIAVDWIAHGILQALAYSRSYGLRQLGVDAALPYATAFRLSGDRDSTATVDDMIAATERGVLITRLNNVHIVDLNSLLLSGNTRDGVWLIERGKITKAVKNLRFTESPLFALNNVEGIGLPQRVFRPEAPAVVPPLLVRDFSLTGLVDAV